jgi:N-acetylmuramic acid 6-phosphate etherase
MVDLEPRSRKLRARALLLVQELAGVSRPRAARALQGAHGRVRVAVVMAARGTSPREAARALRAAGGALRPVLEASPARGRSGRRST